MFRSAVQPCNREADTRGGVWMVFYSIWPARARVLLALVVLIATVALLVASNSSGTGRPRVYHVLPALVIDPNTAPASVLEALPHVGPSLVRQLMVQRRIRPFTSTEDMHRRVRGLGPVMLARLAPHLRIAGSNDSLPGAEAQKKLSAPDQPKLRRRWGLQFFQGSCERKMASPFSLRRCALRFSNLLRSGR